MSDLSLFDRLRTLPTVNSDLGVPTVSWLTSDGVVSVEVFPENRAHVWTIQIDPIKHQSYYYCNEGGDCTDPHLGARVVRMYAIPSPDGGYVIEKEIRNVAHGLNQSSTVHMGKSRLSVIGYFNTFITNLLK